MRKEIFVTCVTIFFVIGLFSAGPAHAQSTPTPTPVGDSSCPDVTDTESMAGLYPDYLDMCFINVEGASIQFQSVIAGAIEGSYLPCGQATRISYFSFLEVQQQFNGVLNNDYSFYFAWPDNKISQEARVRLYFWLPEIAGSVAPPPPIEANWYLRYFWPTGVPVNGVQGAIDELVQYSYRQDIPFFGTSYTTLYLLDITIPTVFVPEGTAQGGFFQFFLGDGSGQAFGHDIMVASVQIDIADAPFPYMCPLDDSYQISTSTPTPTGVWSTPTPGAPGATAPAAATSTPRPWPTSTTKPYVTLIPEPSSTWIPFPTLIPITFPTIHWPTVPTVAITATPTPAGPPTSTPPPTIDSIATLNGNIEALATQWAEPIGVANSYLISETLVLSDTTLTEGANSLMETIALPFRLFKTAQIYSPSTWPFYAAILVSIAVVLGVQLLRFALMIFFFFFEVFRRLWEMLPLN